MQFYFIRHAQSSNNLIWFKTGSYAGRSHDPELSETGRKQAGILAKFLAGKRLSEREGVNGRDFYNAHGFGITHLYSSLMLRAVATGSAVAEALGLPLVGWADLHEFGGLYLDDQATASKVGQAGSSRAYFAERYPGFIVPECCGPEGWWNRPFETHVEAMARTRRAINELMARHGDTDDRVAVISHGDFYNFMFRLLFHVEHDSSWFGLNNTGITRIDFKDGQIELVYANRVDFLPPELVT